VTSPSELDTTAAALQPQLVASVYLHVLREGLASQASEDEKWLGALQNGTSTEDRQPCKGLSVGGRVLCVAVVSLVQNGRVSILRHSGRLLQGLEQRLNKNLVKRLSDFDKVRGRIARGRSSWQGQGT
jgi:hypothetical protein